ncbi:N6-L-threonylcarbamoyladenine synthase, TsaB subunit [Campylobacter iguaniorum]|uniref:N6-L-threonylcarbamoyladenine synthase, TsaB subunit n=2 Tax=Campylobacter iguaniorum TaxID=1244531 RepID=A0A076F975_9BACT|nr:N6-L-threonylcarbamoyladenine synthase, TsaB subunit [Campylobacter iguaniorum]
MALSSPMLVGIYEDDKLTSQIISEEKASEELINILSDLNSKFDIKSITYANGPGSFMGLKVSYAILKTFCIVKKCDFRAVSGFELNDFGAIRANKTLSFTYNNGNINLEKIEPKPFKLPIILSKLNKSCDTLPNYIIDAV